jgi:AcrR family transcriptional regulator
VFLECEQTLVFVNPDAEQDRNAVPAEDTPRRQQRGLQRIEEILDAAERVFADDGYDAATTNQIASAAGISPGSLYQYFDNKKAIAEALCHRYIEQLTSSESQILDPALADLPLEAMVDRVIDPMVAFNLAHPAAKSLLAGADLAPDLAEATKELHDTLCGGVERLIEARVPTMPAAERQLVAEVSVSIYAGLVPSLIAASTPDRSRRVDQLKAAVFGYWSTFDPADP